MRVAKWHCPFCGERFIWNDDDDVTPRDWIGAIWTIMGNHTDRCLGEADLGDYEGRATRERDRPEYSDSQQTMIRRWNNEG